MRENVVVLTGGTSGIGEAAALKFATLGARLVLVARDPQRSTATLGRLHKITPATAHTVHFADLSSIAEVKRVASEITAAEPCIDVLINNAGIISARRQLTSDGLEVTFATNHLAYFVLTHGLLAPLLTSAPSRIVNTASEVHRGVRLDFNDLQSEKGYNGFDTYAKSKLTNVLFTVELARRLSGSGVTTNCLHPGVVASRFGEPRTGNGGDPSTASFLRSHGISSEEGADAIVGLAFSPNLAEVTGQYFNQRCSVIPSNDALDQGAGEKLWRESERLTGIEFRIGQR